MQHSENDTSVEKALLRYVVSHLQEYLDDSSAPSYPEETYIIKDALGGLKTGLIMSDQEGKHYVVVSPACDLVLHKGQCKNDRVHICEIERLKSSNINRHVINLDNEEKKDGARIALQKITENIGALYHHFLPKT